jgi:endonuclease/exonuclease/phosphatase family metal-dependent hydrolase
VLTWNLFHGRSLPPAGRDLRSEFTALLAGWEWDVALLQEVPPWWPVPLAHAAGAQQRRVLTSRNLALPLRRRLAERRPDLIRSNGGGCNAILVRGAIVAHERLRLRTWPERRVAQMLRLQCGTAIVNFHASARVPLAQDELSRLWRAAISFADGRPLVLGGDLNLRDPAPAGGATHVAARDVDHVLAIGLDAAGPAERLPREVALARHTLTLSDHVPLAVVLRAPG